MAGDGYVAPAVVDRVDQLLEWELGDHRLESEALGDSQPYVDVNPKRLALGVALGEAGAREGGADRQLAGLDQLVGQVRGRRRR